MSYAEIGRQFNLSPSGVYYALNPRRAAQHRREAAGRPRSLYLPDDLWAAMTVRADEAGVSTSELGRRILCGEEQPVLLEPVIAAAAVEAAGL